MYATLLGTPRSVEADSQASQLTNGILVLLFALLLALALALALPAFLPDALEGGQLGHSPPLGNAFPVGVGVAINSTVSRAATCCDIVVSKADLFQSVDHAGVLL